MNSRRIFLKNSAIATGALMTSSSFANSKIFATDTIRVATIGVNGQGWSNTQAALKVPNLEVVALCDIDETVLNKRKAELFIKQPNVKTVDTYGDYRKILDRKDIDVVIVGTPDHWHALQMINACSAGKHVYCEKPAGNSIGECNLMVAAKNKYNRIVQVGQWQRSQKHFKDALDVVHSGQLGNIRTTKVWCYQGWMRPQPVVPNSAVPAGVDYKTWLGPAPTREFNASRFHFHFRWFWDYAGGLMTDWGVHLLDYAIQGMNAGNPKSVSALGGKFAYPELAEETPDTLTTLYEFDKFNLVWDSAMGIDNGSYGRDHGIAFIGNNGTLILDRGGWEVIEEKQAKNKIAIPRHKSEDNGVERHWVNFIDAIRNNTPQSLNCPIEAGAHIATIAQMGNIAYRSGKKVSWDSSKKMFTDDAINKTYFTKAYHNGYSLPKV
ncbi:MAG TPA: oxidoreductase [Sphingobacteriaceae bacterium]|nr:oxidoreductase [Sphingobacteriaceae bacterium]